MVRDYQIAQGAFQGAVGWRERRWELALRIAMGVVVAMVAMLPVGCAHPAVDLHAASAPRIGPGDSIYFVMVDRYANGDRSNDGTVDLADPAAFHGGDLQGVIDHLDDLQHLGFTAVWVSPVWKMRTEKFFDHGAFHGYWVDDFTQVEPRFGDRQLLRHLSDELHRRGMKLILDVVLNHVGFDSPLLAQHPDWFHHLGNIRDWNNRDELETHDVMGLPDLAQEKEEVYQYLLATSEKWIDDVRPDGFRLDAVKHVPLAFWARYNRAIREHAGADFWMLGEALEGDPVQVAKVWRDGDFDSMFDFPLYYALTDVFCHGAPVGRLAATLSQDRVYPSAAALVTLADNHDLPRLLTACGGHREQAEAALRFLFDLRGVPSLTYGTEIGLTGEKEPANRADMQFGVPLIAPIGELQAQRRAHPALARGQVRVVALTDDRLELELAADGGCVRVSVASQRVSAVPESACTPVGAATREVELHLHGAPLHPGDQVVAVGSMPEMGSWNPQHGLGPFAAQQDEASARVPLSTGAVYAFKFAVRRADGSVEWETRGDRYLLVGDGSTPMTLDATWGN